MQQGSARPDGHVRRGKRPPATSRRRGRGRPVATDAAGEGDGWWNRGADRPPGKSRLGHSPRTCVAHRTARMFDIMTRHPPPPPSRAPLVDSPSTSIGHSSTSGRRYSTIASTADHRRPSADSRQTSARPTCCGHPRRATTTSCVLGLTDAPSRRIVSRSLARAEAPHLDGPGRVDPAPTAASTLSPDPRRQVPDLGTVAATRASLENRR